MKKLYAFAFILVVFPITMHTITEHPSEPTPVIKPSHAPSMQERLHQLMEENVQAGGSARPI